MADKAYGLLINYEYCTGCTSCEMACSVEHDIPVGQYGIKMEEIGPWQIDKKHWQLDCVPIPTDMCDLCAGLGGGGLRPLAPAIMHQSAMSATMGMAMLQFMQCIGNCFSPIYGGLIDAGTPYWDACLMTIVPLSVVMLICAIFIHPGKNSEYTKMREAEKAAKN